MSEEDLRLQKYLAGAGIASRRDAEKLIKEGKVYVNGRKASLGQKVTPGKDRVTFKGKLVEPEEKVTFLFHKPRGFMCNRDGRRDGESIFDQFEELKPFRVAIGLEKSASGLILLTNDGDLLQRIAVSYRELPRSFSIRVKGKLSEQAFERGTKGLNFEGRRVVLENLKELKLEKERAFYECSVLDHRDQMLEKVFMQLQAPIQRISQIAIAGLRDDLLTKGKGRALTLKELQQLRTTLDLPNLDSPNLDLPT
jgi:23S rRNA pseudouridine2605 synthase